VWHNRTHRPPLIAEDDKKWFKDKEKLVPASSAPRCVPHPPAHDTFCGRRLPALRRRVAGIAAWNSQNGKLMSVESLLFLCRVYHSAI
jgi:hypothetical protein